MTPGASSRSVEEGDVRLQELHADSPHGPWAFVLSLTDWEHRGFTGGETVIFKPHMLDFWSSFDPAKGFEFKDMVCTSPMS